MIPLTKQDEVVDVGTGWGKSAVALSLFNPLPTLLRLMMVLIQFIRLGNKPK